MATKAAVLFLVYLYNLSSGYVLLDDDDNVSEILSLPEEYNIKAERIDLLTDMKLPMELWYSTEYNRSRVDVYGSLVKRYYYWGEVDEEGNDKDGIIYTVHPKWTESEDHTIFCAKRNINENPFAFDAFPYEEDYVYAGETYHEGRHVNVWKFSEDDDDTRRELVLYSYRTEGEDIPVQIEEKEMNTMLGSIDKHVIFNYDHYNPLFCEDDLDAEKEESCQRTPDDFNGDMKNLHPAFHTDLDLAFNSFKKHHNKDYQTKKEHDKRKEVFHKNWQFVVDHNLQNLGFKLALNHLSDLTQAERAMNGGRRSSEPSATLALSHTERQVDEIVTQIPEEYDMRLEAVISPIKNQDMCKSGWSFATTAAVEGALARLDGRLLDLSEQSLIDCSWEGNEGCNGGSPTNALQHIVKHGLPLDEDYGGYLGQNGYCRLENATEVFKIRSFTRVTSQSVNAMKVALYKYGPVVVTIQTNYAFTFYKSGIFYDHTCVEDQINHAVTIVGYGSRDGADYWIVKNSYGEQWGEGGYMLLSSKNNNCFVLNEPYYPVV